MDIAIHALAAVGLCAIGAGIAFAVLWASSILD